MDASRLESVGLLADVSAEHREELAEVLREEKHPRGAVLVEEGDLPTKFYILLSGYVTVHREGRHIADLGPGDFFGEIGVLALEGRNASVIATTPCEAAVAMGWDLRQLLDEMPELKTRLATAAASRVSPD
jgi:CRP/FNR family transcriptional regulator, cyclic AMP receptor protein